MDTISFDFRRIFKKECINDVNGHFFSGEDDVRQRLYILLSSCEDLPQKCSELVKAFNSFTEKTFIQMEMISFDLISILIRKPENITLNHDKYEHKELSPILLTKLHLPLPTKLKLEANHSTKLNVKPNVIAYDEVKNKAIGCQHIPGSVSDSSSSADLLDDDDSRSSSTRFKRKRICQKAGDFELLEHVHNCHFNNVVKCQVEIFVLVGNKAYCETLAIHMGLILFESLLDGEECIERCLAGAENKIYRLAHTGIIKKMMNGFISICITVSISAWQLTQAQVKGFIYTQDYENRMQKILKQENYSVLVENDILAHMEAVGKILQESLLCNISRGKVSSD